MPNMDLKRQQMPVQAPEKRICNYEEVTLGYTPEQAAAEAQRCLNCRNMPCVSGCPVQVQIPAFIRLLASGDTEGAYRKIIETNALPAVCGRVCPQENQCEKLCVRGIKGEPVAIGRLERYVADMHSVNVQETLKAPEKKDKPAVAVVGSGPAGLACAGELVRRGWRVTVFEALHQAGGVLVYGIPEFRLPKSIVQHEIDALKAQGVEIRTNVVIGRSITVDELLQQGYEAVFLGTGAGLPKFMGIPGEGAIGVYSANEFLTRINLMHAAKENSDTPVQRGQRVAVVGGGNVAMDAARCAKRLGADVTIVYRRTRAELPARSEEVEHAIEEGIIFRFLTNPTEVLRDERGAACGLRCLRMELGEPDASGRRRPVEVPGSEHDIEADCVIMALGTSPNPLIRDTTNGLETQRWGGIIAEEETGKTSRESVYAGGDAVTGAATVILAMGAGRQAARAIDEAYQSRMEKNNAGD